MIGYEINTHMVIFTCVVDAHTCCVNNAVALACQFVFNDTDRTARERPNRLESGRVKVQFWALNLGTHTLWHL